jgi:hypothetical protein
MTFDSIYKTGGCRECGFCLEDGKVTDSLLCLHNLQSSESKKHCYYCENRKGGSACQRRLGRRYESVVDIERTGGTLTTFSVYTIFRIVRVRRTVPVVRTGKVVAPVNVADARLVVSVVDIERTGGTLATFSVYTIFKAARVRSTVTIVRTGKVVEPVNVDLVGATRVLLTSRGQGGRSPPSQSTQSSE